jgi:DNA repair protein RecO (recombination protein O)
VRTYNTQAIVLRRIDWREADRLFVLLTRDCGKIEAVARGTKKILSKLNPHLEAGSCANVMLAVGRRGFDKLANATSYLYTPTADISTQALKSLALEITEKLIQSRYAEENIFDQLYLFLESMGSGHEPRVSTNAYLLKLLDALGYRPQLLRCTVCAKGLVLLDQQKVFDLSHGGLMCETCGQNNSAMHSLSISDSVIKIMQLSLDESFATLSNYRFLDEDTVELTELITRLVAYGHQLKPKSLEVLNALNDSVISSKL